MTEDAVIELLPGVLGEIAQACGLGVALTLLREYGGTYVWVPKSPARETALVRCVGEQAARSIIDRFGGGLALLVPLGPLSDCGQKIVEIERLLAAGRSSAQIARQLHCHERTVRRHKRRLKREGPTPPLLALMES